MRNNETAISSVFPDRLEEGGAILPTDFILPLLTSDQPTELPEKGIYVTITK